MTGPWLWDAFAAVVANRADAVALVQGDRSVTFAEVAHTGEAIAGTLDIAPGDRVVLSAANDLGLPAVVAAIWRRGATVVWVNADAPERHVDHAMQRTDAVLAVLDRPERATTGAVVDVATLLDPAPCGRRLPDHGRRGHDPGSIVFTSGSTGLPKGVVQRADTLVDGAARVGRALGYRPDDTILCPIPFAFDYGWGQLLSLLTQGQPLVLPTARNAFSLCQALADHRPTVFAGVPAVFAELLFGLAPLDQTPRDSVRLITTTGSAVSPEILDGLVESFPDAEVCLNYGLTETYRSTSLPPTQLAGHPGSVGLPLPGVLICVIGADGRVLPSGVTGQVLHIGAGAFEGYWGDPDGTARVRRPWLDESGAEHVAVHTGDLGWLDDEGRLHLSGRADHQIKCMGVRVSPDEVESIVAEHEEVREVAVTARDHEMFGSLIVAHVATHRQDLDERDFLRQLRRHARERMSPAMQPREYVVHRRLPRTPNDKVDYVRLRSW